MVFVLFVVGFVLLVKGADYLVSGASSIAKIYNISDITVGLTIVAFGTSMPELVVNVLASLNNNSELAIGNVFGSNIANILLILGISATIYPLTIQRSTILSEIPFSLIAILLVGFLANAALFDVTKNLRISRLDGGFLLLFFALFLIYIFYVARENNDPAQEKTAPEMPVARSVIYVIGGIVALFLGGKWVVDGAIRIAELLGMSEAFIGLTVVAVGTSLPELVTSAIAASKKNSDIAVGNVVGSNIFNILWILGISALVQPLPFEVISNLDILAIVFSTILIIIFLGFSKGNHLGRFAGIVFLLCYIAYIYYLIQRG